MILTPHDRLLSLLAQGFLRKVDWLPSAAPEDGGTAIESTRSRHPKRGMPILNWYGVSIPKRRHDALAAQPNAAHVALSKIEQTLADRLYLCTQNADDLHERGGSLRVHHMHGTLFIALRGLRLPFPDRKFYEDEDNLPTCERCGAPVRPHIVWFGEIPLDMDGIYRELDRATHLLVVGTSGSVYPAAGFVHIANQRGIRTIYVGPEEPLNADAFDEIALGPATEILPPLLSP